MTMDSAMEKARGDVPQSPEQSFLATLSDPHVTLLSVHKQWSFRKSPGVRHSARPVSTMEEGTSLSEEGEFPQRVLNGTWEMSSNQVSAIADGLKSLEGLGPSLKMKVSLHISCVGYWGRSGEWNESVNVAPGLEVWVLLLFVFRIFCKPL